MLEALARAADPDLAKRTLTRLVEAGARMPDPVDVMPRLDSDPRFQEALIAVLGASAALGDHLVANPGEALLLDPRVLDSSVRGSSLLGGPRAVDDPARLDPVPADDVAALRLAYRRALLRIAAADLTGSADVGATMSALTRLAEETLRVAFTFAGGTPETHPAHTRLAVIAMGKCGGGELNYVSDVDVVYVCATDEDLEPATSVAVRLMQICAQVAWPVDASLRPEGGRGPLVRTIAGHLAYYRKWARTWEFQALLKARPVAGDIALGTRWLADLQELVWHAAERPEAVDDIRAMRRRIIDSVPRDEVDREIKRGPGGLRDIEFAVQLLQLVHGRADESLRVPGTIDGLAALSAGGYVGRDDADALIRAYRFLRTVEHRLQLQRLRRTHTVPAATTPQEASALRWLAHALGYHATADRDAVAAFRADWVAHSAEVRRLHAKLLYRPLLDAVARVPSQHLTLSTDAARSRLEVLGYADPAGALRHIQALTEGVSRTAAIQRTLLPVLLSEFADETEPDRGLLAYRQVSDALGASPWYLRLLRDEGPVAMRLATLLGRSRYVTDLLTRDPEALRLLADDRELTPRAREVLFAGFRAAAARHHDPVSAANAVRALRRRELFRIACGDLLGAEMASTGTGTRLDGLGDVIEVGAALADITDATLAATLDTALVSALDTARETAPTGAADLRFAIIGVGRLGGREVSFASDADVLFVYEPPPGVADDVASGIAHGVAEQLRRVLSAPAPEPPLAIDADLRPEGRQGPLVRSLAAYRQYYARWSKVWESQALLRARFVAGDEDLGDRFLAFANSVRYPPGGLTPAQVMEIRRIKARVDTERLPRGADPAMHAKLGRGALTDVEWAVQLLQLRHGHRIEGLRTTSTLGALDVARSADLVSSADSDALAAAWTLASRVRNALMMVRGRPTDQVPRQGVELAGLVRVLGTDGPAGGAARRRDGGEFVDDYLRTLRHARAVFEKIFHA
ncbi:MAG TPA: bifunctional [glutamine synthetase] adenylyltransferase/[glutamine synthetase]-adenylyl-L-tyrosine phosphorylase [Micromonosporaceae bacterium]|nr:bifunctional [glutamine synthetase] adenylyltransferase/[glutamine synthetase]-adenylyl-L-tyrosine phosphorylase [Micromonosporaceae bacterium]